MIKKVTLYYNTIKYLKLKQLYYQINNKIKVNKKKNIKYTGEIHVNPLKMENFIDSYHSYQSLSFTFLNIKHEFIDNSIHWDLPDYGKLWTYNLNYFEFLNQVDISVDEGLKLISDFISSYDNLNNAHEPFPVSLRIINWVKFISRHQIRNAEIDKILYSDLLNLSLNPEYHLLGNHLLENGFALLIGACYFKNNVILKQAKRILEKELNEQILDDGAHFELSPMYHQAIFSRLLDAYNVVKNNNSNETRLIHLLYEKSVLMYSWLKNVTYNNGAIPLVNDSANRISPASSQLFKYAEKLEISLVPKKLNESGYRMIRSKKYELFVDVGNIGPDYLPGHAHSDTFSFELNVNDKPLIVDTGTSTYEATKLRLFERSTHSHNTVMVNGIEQSKVWSSFRVAQRAHIINLKESQNAVFASHDGYKSQNIVHSRSFTYSDFEIVIIDDIISANKTSSIAFIHFHPDIEPVIVNRSVITELAEITFKGELNISMEDFNYAPEFNKLITSKLIKIEFENHLTTNIKIK